MDIVQASEILAHEGLGVPILNALVPNEATYKVLLMQPNGQVEASVAGVRNKDRALAHKQYEGFLEDARQSQADLVVTPEYSMPWDVLIQAIKSGTVPAIGKLWALGCESIKFSEICALKTDIAQWATVISEHLPNDTDRFTDPLAYVFVTPQVGSNTEPKLVILVQFKTYPMGDNDLFEVTGLQRGTRIYQFGGNGQNVSLITLICSDVFDFGDEQIEAIYDRALILHVQLNPKPRHELYRQYRDRLMRFQGDETELICLNWAENVHEWNGQIDKPWQNIAGSAWYLRPAKFDRRDDVLCINHRRGLYYTWLKPLRSHALFFNYWSATFLLDASKVAHIAVPAGVSPRCGPKLQRTSTWDIATAAWVNHDGIADGFSEIVDECGHAKDNIVELAANNPLAVERLLALCTGHIGYTEDWHDVCRLDSCMIDLSEVIRRLTFCQDMDTNASNFRVARLKRCGLLWEIMLANVHFPPALADLKDGFRLIWTAAFPHQNAVSVQGRRATVIYMGEEASQSQIEATAKTVAEFLHRSSSNSDDSLTARQRLAVWFRGEHGNFECWGHDRFISYTNPENATEFDILRETP